MIKHSRVLRRFIRLRAKGALGYSGGWAFQKRTDTGIDTILVTVLFHITCEFWHSRHTGARD